MHQEDKMGVLSDLYQRQYQKKRYILRTLIEIQGQNSGVLVNSFCF